MKKKSDIILRIIAVILLLIYVLILAGFIYMIITGSKYIFSMLFVVIVYPIIIYLLVWLKTGFDRKED